MADYNHESVQPFVAGSAIAQWAPVYQNIASTRDEVVLPANSIAQDIVGLTIATVATPGDPAAVVVSGRAKAVCAASVGAGARVGIASTNGGLGPLVPSGLSTALGSALGAGGLRFAVGRTLKSYAPGEVMTVLLNPQQVI